MSEEREAEKARLRARLAEIEAEEAQELRRDEPPVDAPPPTPQWVADQSRQSASSNPIWIVLGVVILGIVFVALANQCSSTSSSTSSSSTGSVAPPPYVEPPVEITPTWQPRTIEDPMADRPIQMTCIRSENMIRLSWPYHDVEAELCVRASDRSGRDAYVRLMGDGQIICRSYRGCSVRVRFDDGEVQTFSANEAADHSTNIFFLQNVSRFERALESAATTRIEFELYQDGVQSAAFHTEGYEAPRLGE